MKLSLYLAGLLCVLTGIALASRIDGARFSFTVKQETPRGGMVSKWKGTVEGTISKGPEASSAAARSLARRSGS